MITGLGIDACEAARLAAAIERSGARFLARTFVESERQRIAGGSAEGVGLRAARAFALKEATFKALGGGWPDDFSFTDVVVEDDGRRARLTLRGRAAERALQLGVASLHAGAADDGSLVLAAVVAESSAGGNAA